jgi:epoxyqueuosine reductase
MEARGDEGLTEVDSSVRIKAKALDIGFDSVGITDLSKTPHGDAFTDWLDSGKAANMAYMQRQATRRLDPSLIFKGAKRAVVVTKNYFLPDADSTEGSENTGKVARYARGTDYHLTIGKRLAEIADLILDIGGDGTIVRTYVDAGPVPERELAQRAGLGWIGKNTMLIDPQAGSFFFIGSVFTNLELPVDVPFLADRCGECRRCIEACPTGAFTSDRVLDARRCISYLTIESREEHPEELRPLMGDLVFGCDICQDVCPWNQKFASEPELQWLKQDSSLERVRLGDFSEPNPERFDAKYGLTPLERPGPKGMERNARTARGNSNI